MHRYIKFLMLNVCRLYLGVVLICIFLTAKDVEIFSCMYWSFVLFLLRIICVIFAKYWSYMGFISGIYKKLKNLNTKWFISSWSECLSSRKQTTNAGEDAGRVRTLIHCWWECKLVQPLWKSVWRFFRKLKLELPYGSSIPLMVIYLKDSIEIPARPCLSQHYLYRVS
jgi:hypothetical protein